MSKKISQRTPARFAHIIDTISGYASTFRPTSLVVHRDKAITLLKAERARARRVVRRYMNTIDILDDENAAAKLTACDDLLAALKERQ